MQKDFQNWLTLKEQIHHQGIVKDLYFREREVWWCSLGINVGFEQDGKSGKFSRPVLIIRKFNKHIFLGVPLTTKLKDNPFYLPCQADDNVSRAAIISQIRVLSSSRLLDKLAVVKGDVFVVIKKAVQKLL